MEGNTKRNGMALRLLFASAIIVAAVAIVLTWQQPAHERAEAAGGGPEMKLVITQPSGACVGAVCSVTAGLSFTLAVDIVTPPAAGYILAQVWLDWGIYDPTASEDDAGPNTCSDGSNNTPADDIDSTLKDRNDPDCFTPGALVWKPAKINVTADILQEIVWPDCEALGAVRSGEELIDIAPEGPGPEDVFRSFATHGCLTGFIDAPKSNLTGTFIELEFNCSEASSTSKVLLRASGDVAAGTSGALFTEFGTLTQIVPKTNSLTINCIGPTATPTSTPIPPTPTATSSPTPTNTPTPLPPPSERPDVKVTKVDLADPVFSGGTYTYRITVDSIGLQTAEDVVVEDTLPPGTIFKSATSADATCSHDAGIVTCDVTADMAPNDLITIDIVLNAPVLVSDALIENTVTVTSSSEPFANTANNKDIEQTFILSPRSDVTLEKVGDPTFLEGGEEVTYTLIAKNISANTAENVVIIDTLPMNGTFVSATNPECSAPESGVVTCSLGSLGPGGETSIEIVMTAPFVTRSEFLKNTAVISADNEFFFNTGNNLAIENTAVVAPPPDLVVSKTDSQDPVLRLGFYSYEITVLNQGLGDAVDVVVRDTLPIASIDLGFEKYLRAATFESATGATCQELSGDIVECTLDEINAGQQVVITLFVRAPTLLEDESIVNSVTASAADPDENPAGNDASEQTLVRACFDVNGDLIVDLPNDILSMILHLGLFAADPEYDVIYDFDGDGFIGLPQDLLQVILHFAQDCSLLL